MTCDVCGLPDNYRGRGDGIGSCDCPRCSCGSARGSQFCTCEADTCDCGDPDCGWLDRSDDEWPDDVTARPVETVELPDPESIARRLNHATPPLPGISR